MSNRIFVHRRLFGKSTQFMKTFVPNDFWISRGQSLVRCFERIATELSFSTPDFYYSTKYYQTDYFLLYAFATFGKTSSQDETVKAEACVSCTYEQATVRLTIDINDANGFVTKQLPVPSLTAVASSDLESVLIEHFSRAEEFFTDELSTLSQLINGSTPQRET